MHFLALLLGLSITTPWTAADTPPLLDWVGVNTGRFGKQMNQTYRSSKIRSPLFQVNVWNKSSVSNERYLFLTPTIAHQKSGPMIFDKKDLSLVYANPSWSSVSNARMQMFNGKPYLTYWAGQDMVGHGLGSCLLYDTSYRLAYNVSTSNLSTMADSHECQLTGNGTAIVTAYERKPWDLSRCGGPKNGTLLDSIFQEVDIATNKPVFTWRASQHFDVAETAVSYRDTDYGKNTTDGGFDFFHINSIEKTPEGNYLVSGRRLKVLALISGKDGSRLWQVGGRKNNFTDLSHGWATNFGYQHHARFVPGTGTGTGSGSKSEITLFDNHWMWTTQPSPGCRGAKCSRALHLSLDHDAMTVEIVAQYYHPLGFQCFAMGGYQHMANGNALVGWGTLPVVTEFAPNGNIVLDLQLGPYRDAMAGATAVYRAYAMDWKGMPTWKPDIAFEDGWVYLSWNGATEVVRWVVVGGNDTADMGQVLVDVAKRGFETAVELPEAALFVSARAMAEDGRELGSTAVFDVVMGMKFTDGEQHQWIKTPWGNRQQGLELRNGKGGSG